MSYPRKAIAGFNLIQISILLTVASLVMVAVLPSPQSTVKNNASSVTKMNTILTALRQYEAATCTLPCPADPTLPIGDNNYGRAAANSGTTGNCIGGTPTAAYADTTKHIAIGMVPIYTLGLSYDYALDNWGRDITYAVDTGATQPGGWAPTLSITVNDNGNAQNSVVALVSHGKDGYGAWLPLTGTSGTATRFDNGSTDTGQADNAQVAHGGGLTANTTFASFIIQNATPTFDDNIIYKNPLWNINSPPAAIQAAMTPPANGTYTSGQTLTFTITTGNVITVTGTPRLTLYALSSGTIGASNTAYANYTSGSGTNTLTFTYTIQATDSAPTAGLAMKPGIDLNGGTLSSFPNFCPPNLSQILITNGYLWVADMGNNRVLKLNTSGTFVMGLGSSYNGDSHAVGSAGSSVLRFTTPTDVKIDSSGNIWVADSRNYRVLKYNSSGQWLMTIGGAAADTCAGTYVNSTTCANIPGHTACCAPNASSCTCNSGTASGQFDTYFGSAQQMAFDTSGNLWVTDYNNNRVQEFDSNTGQYLGGFTKASSCPSGMTIDNNNTIWLSGDCTNAVYKCTTAGSCTKVNSVSLGCNQCTDYVTFDPSTGNIWANDQGGNVQKFNSSGTYLGLWSNSHTTNLEGIYHDGSSIWIADDVLHNIYKIDPSTGNIQLTIGTGASGTGTNPVQFKKPQNMFMSTSR